MATQIEMIGCDCGCDCCEPAPSDAVEERELLVRQKRLINQRLSEIERR